MNSKVCRSKKRKRPKQDSQNWQRSPMHFGWERL